MVTAVKIPQPKFKSQNYDNLQLNGQDADNSSFSDLLDEDNSQSSFNSFDPIGANALGWSPWLSGAETGAQSFLGWGWSVALPGVSFLELLFATIKRRSRGFFVPADPLSVEPIRSFRPSGRRVGRQQLHSGRKHPRQRPGIRQLL